MSLIEYRLKRDFRSSSEPRSKSSGIKKEPGQRFVIQRHDASHLHFDFRLEMKDQKTDEVVLKSWAIPKNIPLEKQTKHLAIQTEDHPVEYINFEGEIPNGNYGAGIVEIWDCGKWGMMSGSVEKGSISFNLFGERVKGRYQMIRTKGLHKQKVANKEDKKNYWLIWRKGNDIF